MKNKLITMLVTVLIVSVFRPARAHTVTVFVDPSTWVIDTSNPWSSSDGSEIKFYDEVAAHQDQYGYWHYRYYAGGFFDTVVFENKNTFAAIQTLSANNIFYIDRTVPAGYALSLNYNESGNGVSGEVWTAKALGNGDLWIGGDFTTAGGNSNTSYLSCYQWSSGWSGVNNIYAQHPIENAFSWNGSYQLVITVSSGGYVHGPTSSGGTYGNVGTGSVLGNNYTLSFASFWFQ